MTQNNSIDIGILRLAPESSDEAVGGQFAGSADPTNEQSQAIGMALDWFPAAQRHFDKDVFTFAGVAGSGKSFCLGHLANHLGHLRVAYAAPTGRAASVLGRSLRSCGVTPRYCGTIHRLLYRPITEGGVVHGWQRKDDLEKEYDLLVLDEASMISAAVLADLRQCGVPILAVGDHAQLPPVGEDVHLMLEPDVRLEEVHRQALENPVLAFATLVRTGGDWRTYLRQSTDPRLRCGSVDDASEIVAERFSSSDDTLVLCGRNRTRTQLNNAARVGARRFGTLVKDDLIVCLKNFYLQGLLLANGFRGRILGAREKSESHMYVDVDFPEERLELREAKMWRKQLGAEKTVASPLEVQRGRWEDVGLLLDYGYAMTGHRAQGTQSRRVILVVEDFADSASDFNRWLYSTSTRAVEELVVLT